MTLRKKIPHDACKVVFSPTPPPSITRKKNGWMDGRMDGWMDGWEREREETERDRKVSFFSYMSNEENVCSKFPSMFGIPI